MVPSQPYARREEHNQALWKLGGTGSHRQHLSCTARTPRGGVGTGSSRQQTYAASLGTNIHGEQAYNEAFPCRGGSLQDWKSGWVDTRNHKIEALMDPYLERFNGRIHLTEVLNVAGKCQTDLPMLPRFCHANGRPFLCWNSTLG
jgi:hypothetical protein